VVDLYLVRHCAARGNVDGVYQGRGDSDITDLGRRQLEAVAVRLRNVPFHAIYTSPLKRARATAEAINQYHHVPLYADNSLLEIDVGQMEGLKWSELPKRFPKEADAWQRHLADFKAPGGESTLHVQQRIWSGIEKIVKKENQPNQTVKVCVTTHGCALRCFFCKALGWPLSRIDEVPLCDNTAISEVTFAENGKVNVLRIGDAAHLDQSMSVLKNMGWGLKKA
jgi:broad specificity phosphatase PhoE